jgi:ParB-like chromosome segregation protein Spo0J
MDPAKSEADDHRCEDAVGSGNKRATTSGGLASRNILLSEIVVPDNRMRKLRSEVIDQLSSSIREGGLLQPIVLSAFGSRFKLVAGRHRLEAVKRLDGHLTIKAIVLEDVDAGQALLA